MEEQTKSFWEAIEHLLEAQRAFLLGVALCHEGADSPEAFPNMDPKAYFEKAFMQAWECNEMIAKKLDLHPRSADEIREHVGNETIVNDFKVDLEQLYKL